MTRAFIIGLLLLTGCCCCPRHRDPCDVTCRRQRQAGPAIPNLAVVDEARHIYRGGQPTEAGWLWLRDHGVTLDVKLDTDAEGSDDLAARLGLTVWKYPITLSQQLGLQRIPPDFFDNLNSRLPEQGIFIHCLHGQDRTGLEGAFLRIRKFGWPKARAYREMLDHGFHQELGGLWRFWRESTADLPEAGSNYRVYWFTVP